MESLTSVMEQVDVEFALYGLCLRSAQQIHEKKDALTQFQVQGAHYGSSVPEVYILQLLHDPENVMGVEDYIDLQKKATQHRLYIETFVARKGKFRLLRAYLGIPVTPNDTSYRASGALLAEYHAALNTVTLDQEGHAFMTEEEHPDVTDERFIIHGDLSIADFVAQNDQPTAITGWSTARKGMLLDDLVQLTTPLDDKETENIVLGYYEKANGLSDRMTLDALINEVHRRAQ